MWGVFATAMPASEREGVRPCSTRGRVFHSPGQMPKLHLVPQPRARADVIVVGSDLAGTSDAALNYALHLGRALVAQVVVVHIAEHI